MDGNSLNGLLILLVMLAIYLFPTIVASGRGHRSAGAVFALNLLLGWTFVGWVIALVWALTYQGEPRVTR